MRGCRHLRGTNVHGTRKLLRLAVECDIRAFQYISSTSAAGPGATGYGLNKWAVEQRVLRSSAVSCTAHANRPD
jgi:nucleoside-diphosphate-sugar epimerase